MTNEAFQGLIVVTDDGFASYQDRVSDGVANAGVGLYHLEADAAPEDTIEAIFAAEEVHIPFASSADGRGFSLARRLRDFGYQGRVFAIGALVCDQYRHARQSGFDGVLLTAAQAQKMPEPFWLEQARRVPLTYRHQIYAL